MIPYAAEHNFRVVRLNFRDYPGSSPYTSSELDAFQSNDRTVVQAAIKTYGAEVAAFLAWFAEHYDLPLPRHDANTANGTTAAIEGGMALLIWSSTNSAGISMLAHAPELPEKTRDTLEKYLRAYIMLGTCQCD